MELIAAVEAYISPPLIQQGHILRFIKEGEISSAAVYRQDNLHFILGENIGGAIKIKVRSMGLRSIALQLGRGGKSDAHQQSGENQACFEEMVVH
jgi:hypothetical protein